jgi:hypothetical protein
MGRISAATMREIMEPTVVAREARLPTLWTTRAFGVHSPGDVSMKMLMRRTTPGGNFNRDYVQAYRYPGAHSGTSVLNLLASDTDLSYAYTLDARVREDVEHRGALVADRERTVGGGHDHFVHRQAHGVADGGLEVHGGGLLVGHTAAVLVGGP